MKILFVYPDMITRDPGWSGYYYEGIAILSAVARAAGHSTALLHAFRPMADGDVIRWVDAHRDGDDALIAFSATVAQFPHIRRWARLIKQATGLPVIVGGVHATLSPEDVIGAAGVDMICRGDGERALLEVVARLEAGQSPQGVPGIWYRDEAGEVVRQPMDALTDLSTLPPPDWEIYTALNELEYFRDGVGVHNGSRGCPYDCSFCCARTLMEATKGLGSYFRTKPVQQLVGELELYLERRPDTWAFMFEDDNFGLSPEWLEEFAEVYPREIARPFGCNIRPNLVTPELVGLYVRAGCKQANIGLDAGSERIRNDVLNRRQSRERIIEAFELCRDAGIRARAYNIIASPGETPQDIIETIKLNARIDPPLVQHTIFYPYEGTPLHDLVVEKGLLDADREVTCYFKDTALAQPSIRRKHVLMFNDHFQALVRLYTRILKLPRPLRNIARSLTDTLLTWRGAPASLAVLSRLRRLFAGCLPGRPPGTRDSEESPGHACDSERTVTDQG